MTQGTLVILSAPSGGGKNAIMRELMKLFPGSTRFVTTTTRAPREGEREQVDYHFVSTEKFQQMIEEGAFIEYNFYAGNYYGSEKSRLEENLATSPLVFAPLDVNGKKQIDASNVPHISIFLLPESLDILRQRIIHRGGLTTEEIDARMKTGEAELEEAKRYDLAVINQDGEMRNTVEEIAKFLEARLNA